MSEQRTVKYQILSFSLSDFKSESSPFAVVLWRLVEPDSSLSGFALKNLPHLISDLPCDVREAVEMFLGDIRCIMVSTPIEHHRFVKLIDGLSVGPIRTLHSGQDHSDRVDAVLAKYMLNSSPSVIWPDAFDPIVA